MEPLLSYEAQMEKKISYIKELEGAESELGVIINGIGNVSWSEDEIDNKKCFTITIRASLLADQDEISEEIEKRKKELGIKE